MNSGGIILGGASRLGWLLELLVDFLEVLELGISVVRVRLVGMDGLGEVVLNVLIDRLHVLEILGLWLLNRVGLLLLLMCNLGMLVHLR